MKIRIWGVRGSIPTPITSQEIEEKIYQAIYRMPGINTGDQVAIRAYVRNLPLLVRGTVGGNTTCVEIQTGENTIIIDAGTGIYHLGLALLKGLCGKGQGVLHFVFSHPHWDHIQGFPMFIPAFIPGNRFFFHSIHDFETALREQQRFQYFPVTLQPEPGIPHHNATMTFIRHEVGESFDIGRVHVTSSLNNHPGRAYAYRFQDQHSAFVFASDAEYKDLEGEETRDRIAFFQDADAVLFDAQYGLRDSWESKVDFGHSSAMIGVYMAQQARAKRLLLTHHDPNYTDQKLLETLQMAEKFEAQNSAQSSCEVMLAYEGLELDLAPIGKVDIATSVDGKTTILTASATFDQGGVEILRSHLAKVKTGEAPAGSVIDLSEVEQLTPAGLKALVKLSWDRRTEPIVLASPSPKVQETIRLGGYRDYFAIYPTVTDAVQAVEARRALELPGQIVSERYLILEKLEQGRLGTILKARDQKTDRLVALKLLSPAFSSTTIERLGDQMERVLKLKYPAIVEVLDWGHVGERYYLVENWVTGTTLAEYLTHREPLQREAVETLVMALLKALEYAHQHGVIHGHLKPEDIFLTETGVQLGGFGLARLEEGHNFQVNPAVFLQAAYLSPEQILGRPL
ncbi:MAG TPA: protein kinase, partial [Anaerolineales bacterium]|nr:protein kinase [Anaerolineales bacterium]